MQTGDVILAIASPPGHSPRGIIRISGDETFALLEPRLKIPAEKTDAGRDDLANRLRRRGAFRTRLQLNNLSIPAIALLFPGPNSYTGEDAAELQLPGNPVLLERIIDGIITSGAERNIDVRRAEPGEFTARAFFNERMTLTEAEGVAATVAARSDAELRAAQLLLRGDLGAFAQALADDLASALALVEAGIDFTDEEDVVAIAPTQLVLRLRKLLERTDDRLGRCVGMEQLRAIPWVVLTGRTNAGKSTLFNALLRRERAVVSIQPGTTRDVLAEPLEIHTSRGPAEVMLIDLAGAERAESALGEQMQEAAREATERAELILHCRPADESDAPGDVETPPEVTLIVRTKADLLGKSAAAEIERGTLIVSAQTGRGLDELRDTVAGALADRAVSLASDAIALQPRHEADLRAARNNLAMALELIEPVCDAPDLSDPELVAAAMRSALDALASLAGNITADDVLGRVFATFCVGK